MGDLAEVEKPRKVMVAVDESEESFYALKWCLINIFQRNGKSNIDALVVLHVKRPTVVFPTFHDAPDFFAHDVVASIDLRDRQMARWIITKAEKFCEEHNVKMEGRVEEGDPRDVICEMVKTWEADLLVMGSHGYGPLTRTLMESVSKHCVQNASCPVLVIKMPKSTS